MPVLRSLETEVCAEILTAILFGEGRFQRHTRFARSELGNARARL